MRKLRECFRLRLQGGLSFNQIALALGVGRSSVQDYFRRLEHTGLSPKEALELTDAELEMRLFKTTHLKPRGRPLPECTYLHGEMKKRGVTLRLLWEEYLQDTPDGYRYTQFCDSYRKWLGSLKLYMRQTHVGGERLFVDYSGKRPHFVDEASGEIIEAELLVLCWGASHLLYAEAQPTQQKQHFLMGLVRGFEYFGCVSRLLVPDNLKSAVRRAHTYDPDVDRDLHELSNHYGFGVLPARPRKPQDKSKVEVGVQIVQRWIVARLRNRVFHSLGTLNEAIKILLDELNAKPMKALGKSRRELFEELDRPHALPLPSERYVFGKWSKERVGMDYCVQVQRHSYSVPYAHYGQELDIRLTEMHVEMFRKSERIAIHMRSSEANGFTIDPAHMPTRHKKHKEATPDALLHRAEQVGPSTLELVERILKSQAHPEVGFRPALGILRLADAYGAERLEKAAKLALVCGMMRMQQVQQILKNRMEERILPMPSSDAVVDCDQVRGADYYHPERCLPEVAGDAV